MESLGAYLRREREYRVISLDDVARATKIGLPQLKSLEADDYDALPGVVITRGFLRSYAGFVGLDAQEILFRYEATLKERQIKIDESFNKLKPVMTRGRSAFVVGVLGFIVLLVIFYLSMR